jgi:hypothetical protein
VTPIHGIQFSLLCMFENQCITEINLFGHTFLHRTQGYKQEDRTQGCEEEEASKCYSNRSTVRQ